MLLGNDVEIGDLIRLNSGREAFGIIVGYKTVMARLICGDGITYSAIVNGQEIYLIRESFEIIKKLSQTEGVTLLKQYSRAKGRILKPK